MADPSTEARLEEIRRAMAKADDYARRLHKALGVPLVTTSLNAHGQSPAHDLLEAKQVAESWGIPCIEQSFDAVGPSTILLWRDGWEVLRRGIGIMP